MRIPSIFTSVFALILSIYSTTQAAPPRVLLEGAKLELVAKDPQLVTPVGVTFDGQGRLLVIESHTHQRPDGYEGPAGDKVKMLADSDGDGKLDQWSVFAEGFQQAMNVMARPDGWVYIVTRRKVTRHRDTDGDGQSDVEERIVTLETDADYPHNGLSGIVTATMNNAAGKPIDLCLGLGLGENFGADYKLVGSDGSSISGSGGVGIIFSCTMDGRQLGREATGFWNPFSIALQFDPKTLVSWVFTVDNDPDASPPCRLIHVVPSGDYGHRWEYGRAGLHPLQAWDGELPGTLPMICGTGEAPTAVIAHRGHLWVTSWGDHRIERYALTPKGLTFEAEQKIVVQGDTDFRPTGMAVGPDGSLYFADWVDRSYPVHGKGRLWKLSFATDATENALPIPNYNPGLAGASLTSEDPYERAWAVSEMPHYVGLPELDETPVEQFVNEENAWLHLAQLQAHRRDNKTAPAELLAAALKDASADVRLYAVRWVADERIVGLRDEVAKLLEGELPSERYYLAVLAAVDWLDGNGGPHDKAVADRVLVNELKNPKRPPEIQALALRLLSPNHKYLNPNTLNRLLNSPHHEIQLEAVRTLAQQKAGYRFAKLSSLAKDTSLQAELRAEAIVGLSSDAKRHHALLIELSMEKETEVAEEAFRVLRLAGLASEDGQPVASPAADDLAAWSKLLATAKGDAAAGRRLFFSHIGPRCATCHQHGGRGGRVGPDLTRLAESTSRRRILASILQPSAEIAPRYVPWVLYDDRSRTHVGLRMPQGGDNGSETYSDPQGNLFTLRSEQVESREPSDISIMPGGLENTLSVEDLRDLLAFLAENERKKPPQNTPAERPAR